VTHDALLRLTNEILDWVGTIAFALSGGLLGVRKQFDLFGVLFLSFVVAVAGGVMRDVFIGALPPAAILEIHYFLIAVGAGLVTFYWYPRVASMQHQILLFDAVGLGLFAVIRTQKAIEQRKTLQSALDRQDAIIAGLQSSPYLRALADGAQVAFVPYANLSNVSKGTTLYACSLGMFWCHDVGKVVEVLPGEVTFKHPHKDQMLRGQMVELKLDNGAAQEDVLFAGGKPLGL